MKKIISYCKQIIFIIGFLTFLYYCGFAIYDSFKQDWLGIICCVCLIYVLYRMVKHFFFDEEFYPKD